MLDLITNLAELREESRLNSTKKSDAQSESCRALSNAWPWSPRTLSQQLGFPKHTQNAVDVKSPTANSSRNAAVLLKGNVHQNVHQRIKPDRFGYVWIDSDSGGIALIINVLHSDSDPLPRIPVDLIGYGRIVPD